MGGETGRRRAGTRPLAGPRRKGRRALATRATGPYERATTGLPACPLPIAAGILARERPDAGAGAPSSGRGAVMIPFHKYTGAGNDFVIVRERDLDGADPAALARRICPRETGAGVDGLALVRDDPARPAEVRFFNPDGTEFSTCGNGTRCVARYLSEERAPGDGPLRIATADGEVRAEVDGERVALDYRIEAEVEGEIRVALGAEEREGWLVRVGTPHLVVPLDSLPEGPIDELCSPARRDPRLGPEGANVDLVALEGRAEGSIRTFERGVEGETLACGAGAMASLLALRETGRCGPRLTLLTRSGERLRAELPDPEDPSSPRGPGVRHIRLSGPARPVFEGRFPAP